MPQQLSFWFEYASPYSMVSALRLFLASNKGHSDNALTEAAAQRSPNSCTVPALDGIQIMFKPVFLGALFKQIGQRALPNIAIPQKGLYMFHDVSRSLAHLGYPNFPSTQPTHWPSNTTLAGRMTWLLTQGPEFINKVAKESDAADMAGGSMQVPTSAFTATIAEFVWRVYEAEFLDSLDIGDSKVMATLWDKFVCSTQTKSSSPLPNGAVAVELASRDMVKRGFKNSTSAAVEAGVFGAPTFITDDGDLYWGNDRMLDAINHCKNGKTNGSTFHELKTAAKL